MAEDPMQSISSQKRRPKRKRIQKDPELDRLDSLSWKSSIPRDDALSAFIGSNDLEGGFLSLEEIDEAEYGLTIPKPETVKQKLTSTASKKSKKGEQDNVDGCGGASGDGEGSMNKEEGDNMNMETNKKGKKEKKKKKKKKKNKVNNEAPTSEEDVAENIGGSDSDRIETEVGDEMDGGDDLEMEKKLQKKKKGTKDHGIDKEIKDEVEKDAVDETEYYAWNELRLHPLLMKSIYKLGFKEPTAIQKACIPAAAYQGKDVVGAAETGSGKTLAFGLPILQRLLDEREKSGKKSEEEGADAGRYAPRSLLRALIITPTRELAIQVTDHLKAVAVGTNIRVVPIVGGMSTEKQERLLRMRPEIVVGTPGRLWELMSGGERHLVELQTLSFFVLDEADRMIENGHFRELQSIIDMLPVANCSTENSQNAENSSTSPSSQRKKRQTLVFSATLSLSSDFRKKLKRGSSRPSQSGGMDGLNSIEALSERAGIRPNVAIINLTNTSVLANNLEESFIECREEDKDAYLYYILSVYGKGRTIVFCTSIAALRHISALLCIVGINVLTLHAQRQQRARLKAIDRFRGRENGILIATDVAARGLDIPGVRTVVHYQLPHSAEVYVHRSGRTARASADGCSIALVSANETSKFATLCKSFSKESFQRFPVDNSYMPEVLKRLSLARQIDKILRKDSQEKAKKTWFERNAELVELVVDNDDSEDERANNHKQKKFGSMQLKKLQEELGKLLSHPLQPKSFSHRYLAGAGVSPLLQHQFEEMVKQNGTVQNTGDNKRRKLAAIGQDLTEPLQALRTGGQQVHMDAKEMADKRKKVENLRRKKKEEKKRLRDQRRNKRKQMKGKI
ncbi:DEAD-box ATP-dependent RNA helicase 13 [Cucurbita pepo subsp. pepo]|uniref:DEAD-box ATP-dependent RNA helicase 13 n=1 Tax=Cucurbita pepo subsp. pepo TaxID=3664 RepID=UPI000C9D811B|nr:DEAD-box ATP-dependent RNA helicase 13 [Cucurbita pepo subsp. pepo]XP_023514561.1 DEAD-box ATP-dependent RNA helicase 13 [Cucurbita pepo subsp. pepo]XP_023514562.1 DEAD-box ATP-dependent RNA helicase 13 [Cucurbita pepo subsp. pepo]